MNDPYFEDNDEPYFDDLTELQSELEWRKILHNHTDIFGHDTCPLCVIEAVIYGGTHD